MSDIEALVTFTILAIPVVILIRWLVWRGRYRRIQNALSSLEKKQGELLSQLSALEKRIAGGPGPWGEALGTVEAEAVTIAEQPERPAIAKEAAPPSPFIASRPTVPSVAEHPPEIEKAVLEEVKEVAEVPAAAFEAKPPEEAPEAIIAGIGPVEKLATPEPHKERVVGAVTKKVKAKPTEIALTAKRALTRLILGEGEMAVDWEALIGGRWLNLVGIVLLVVGIVLLTQQTLLHLGASGKVAVGVGISVALLILGVPLQRAKGYRLLAQTLIGGGWAILYFTAFAAHNIEAARIIDDPRLALALLSLVAAGIIVHSFTYRSQLLTGLAYALGFLAVTMSPVTIFSLVASGLLAASLIVVIRLMPWQFLVLLGVAGTYLNHWRWISGIAAVWLEPVTQDPAFVDFSADQSFWLSTGILAFYWVLFVAVSLSRRPKSETDAKLHFVLSVANTVGFLSLSAWQIWDFHGGYLHFLAAPATVAYIVVAYLDRAFGQRTLFLLNASVAVLLFAITPELAVRDWGFSRDWLAPYWTVGAGLALLAGYHARELLLRLESYLLCIPVLFGAWFFNLSGPLAEQPSAFWVVVPLIIAFFQLISEWLQRMAGRRDILPDAVQLGGAFGFAATLLLARLLWSLVGVELIGVLWLAAAFISFEWGVAKSRLFLRTEGYALAALAAFAVFFFNIVATPDQQLSSDILATAGTFSLKWLPDWAVATIIAATLYILYWRLQLSAWARERLEAKWASIPSFAGTALVAALAYKELDLTVLAAAWMAWGLILFQVGELKYQPLLRLQGYVLSALAFAAAIGVNIYELLLQEPTDIGPRIAVVGFVILGLYYVFQSLVLGTKAKDKIEVSVSDIASYAATLLLALLLWKELPSVAVAVAWSFLGLALFELAAWRNLAGIRQLAHLLIIAAFARLFLANFVALGDAFEISHRLITVIPVIATIYYLRMRLLERAPVQIEKRPSWFAITESVYTAGLYSYAAAILIVVLARFEFGRAYAVVAWAPLAFGLLVLGQRTGNIDFRFQSYLIAILTFARSWSTNAYLIGSFYGISERLVTTLPAAGVFFAAAFICNRPEKFDLIELRGGLNRILIWIDGHARFLFSALASLLVSVLIYFQLSIDLVSIGWAIQGFVLLILGFLIKDRPFRLYGLALLFVCLLKVTLFDLEGVETIYRIFSFIFLGVILLLASLTYTRYRSVLSRYI